MPSRWTLRCQGGGQQGNGEPTMGEKRNGPILGAEISTIIRHHSFLPSFLCSFLRSFMHVRFQFLRSSCLILSSCLHHACFYFHHSFFSHCWRVIVHQSFFCQSVFVRHHSSFISHSSSFIHQQSSYTRHRSSFITQYCHRSSFISCHFSLILRHLSFKKFILVIICHLPFFISLDDTDSHRSPFFERLPCFFALPDLEMLASGLCTSRIHEAQGAVSNMFIFVSQNPTFWYILIHFCMVWLVWFIFFSPFGRIFLLAFFFLPRFGVDLVRKVAWWRVELQSPKEMMNGKFPRHCESDQCESIYTLYTYTMYVCMLYIYTCIFFIHNIQF